MQEVLWHLDFPSLDIVIIHQIIERGLQLAPKMLESLCPAAAEITQRCYFHRERPGMGRQVELQPAGQILAFQRQALVPVDERVGDISVQLTQIGIEAVNKLDAEVPRLNKLMQDAGVPYVTVDTTSVPPPVQGGRGGGN